MRERVGLCFVLTWLSCALAYKQCSDCKVLESCEAAQTVFRMATPASIEKLQAAFCGYDDHEARAAKVCCSELASIETRGPEPSTDSVEGHHNLHLLPDNCGSIDGDKIFGGTIAGIYEYPWMVLLSYKRREGLRFDCGGTLINERYVLTAAHCVINQPLQGVRIGEHDYYTEMDCEGIPPHRQCEDHIQDMRFEKIIPHPDYTTSSKQRDIALIRLKKKADFSFRNVGAVCLPVTQELRNRVIVGMNATIAGWGITETTRKSTKLLTVDVPIANSDDCSHLFNRRGQSEESFKICAGQKGLDSCNGDSGGPLMLKGNYKDATRLVEYGVVSTGPYKCGSGQLASYTNVAKHMKWILDNIEP